MKALLNFLLVTLVLIVTSCSSGSNQKIENAVNDHILTVGKPIHVLAIEVGENVKVNKEPYAKHYKTIPTAGRTIYNNVWLTNQIFYNTPLACLGCDSCMTAFAKAGLINYDVKADGSADISLTSKGEKYRIEKLLPEFELDNRDNYEFVVLAYTEANDFNIISNYKENHYLCKSKFKPVVTPFLECMGYDKSQEESSSIYSDSIYWDVRIYTDEEHNKNLENNSKSKPYKIEQMSKLEHLFDNFKVDSYDLNQYTKELALEDYLNLSDTMAVVSEKRMNWDGLYLSQYGKFSDINEIPQAAKEAFLWKNNKDYYFLVGTKKLGKIISDKKMPSEDSDGQFGWNLEELYYTVDIDYTEFGATTYGCPQQTTFYGKIPYIIFDNILYFIPDASGGMWSEDKDALKEVKYCDDIHSSGSKIRRPHFSTVSIPLSIFKSTGGE